jgi:ApbE superfamily uncharacterized protein (UPF0280 family)
LFEPRFYRSRLSTGNLCLFEVVEKETDLLIAADVDLSRFAVDLTQRFRSQIEKYIQKNSIFLSTYVPIEIPDSAPEIVKTMGRAANAAGVGPMAAVAGAMSEYVGRELLNRSKEIIIENGGDIFIKTDSERKIGIYAGDSPLNNKLAIVVKPEDTPLGVCTSSGTVGHSVSFGKADAVAIMSKNSALADAVATSVGNLVRSKKDIETSIEHAKQVRGIDGVIIVIGDSFGAWGKFELSPA